MAVRPPHPNPPPQGGREKEGPPDIEPDALAFLQYTSGSTAAPKGVMVTHANLMHNLASILESFPMDAGSRSVSWLPAHHDMGLIGGVLASFYSGRRVVLMSPLAFIQRPIRWLWAISKYRPAATAAPVACRTRECPRRR